MADKIYEFFQKDHSNMDDLLEDMWNMELFEDAFVEANDDLASLLNDIDSQDDTELDKEDQPKLDSGDLVSNIGTEQPTDLASEPDLSANDLNGDPPPDKLKVPDVPVGQVPQPAGNPPNPATGIDPSLAQPGASVPAPAPIPAPGAAPSVPPAGAPTDPNMGMPAMDPNAQAAPMDPNAPPDMAMGDIGADMGGGDLGGDLGGGDLGGDLGGGLGGDNPSMNPNDLGGLNGQINNEAEDAKEQFISNVRQLVKLRDLLDVAISKTSDVRFSKIYYLVNKTLSSIAAAGDAIVNRPDIQNINDKLNLFLVDSIAKTKYIIEKDYKDSLMEDQPEDFDKDEEPETEKQEGEDQHDQPEDLSTDTEDLLKQNSEELSKEI